ncbi:hypothetical protein [Dendronalium sp. ChiSLP03b]|uniref:hypothetical protein n=1 Tax=Dendronalium sp. ChiSLP03b TaxID=3075381 RepID=UPI002AD215ED|nr:hypothetical protein [Dendronalium sp. ChiSLP03b]MDZ8203831.1 hypothetical protein [Dendronalium sp. ChiSLP03b]
MRSQHEPQVFSAVIKHSQMEGEFLHEMSNNYLINKTSLKDITWENLCIPEMLIYGMRITGFPSLQKETYENWISMNNQTYLLTPFITNPQVTLISEEEFDKLGDKSGYGWSIFYTLSRPGFSQDFSQALIQITAHCPAGPPQYGSLLYLESTGEQWEVKSSYGLYNQ